VLNYSLFMAFFSYLSLNTSIIMLGLFSPLKQQRGGREEEALHHGIHLSVVREETQVQKRTRLAWTSQTVYPTFVHMIRWAPLDRLLIL
jgi:hypothetical protein